MQRTFVAYAGSVILHVLKEASYFCLTFVAMST
jgi:hypothetical protein